MKSNFKAILGRSWLYIVFLGSYAFAGLLVAFGYPEYSGFVIGALFIALIPTAFTVSLAVPFADHYVRFHKRLHKPDESIYKTNAAFQHAAPRLRIVARSTVISIFGILYLIVSVANITPELLLSATGVVLIITSLLFAIFLAPSLNIASWLLIKAGVMYENKVDGTRINLGKDLQRFLQFAIGPIAAINFGRVMFSAYPDFGVGLAFILIALMLSVPSVIVTMLLLRRKALARMSMQLNERLNKHIL